MMNQENILQHIMSMPISEQASLAYTLDNYLADQIPDQFSASSNGMDHAFLTELDRRSAYAKAQLPSLRSADEVLAVLRTRQAGEQSQ